MIYSWDDKAEFSASLPQSSVSRDPSEIILICWFGAQETFIIIINVENGFELLNGNLHRNEHESRFVNTVKVLHMWTKNLIIKSVSIFSFNSVIKI